MHRTAFVLVVVAACSSRSSTSRDAPEVTPVACSVTSTGDLPGVSITLSSTKCSYRVGEPATFEYVLVTTDVPPLHVPDGDGGCGTCASRGPDPAGWVDYAIGGISNRGTPMTYCVCDTGCCPPDEERTVSVDDTTVSESIDWSGRQWTGPSDTGNPMGEYFEPGAYVVTVGFYGGDTGQVVAELPILVED